MKIALGADDTYPILKTLYRLLCQAGHVVSCFGTLGVEGPNSSTSLLSWPQVGLSVGEAVSQGRCEEGIVLCWSGTGVCISANKVKGIRAALCTDAQTATVARLWNHANVLALSSRLLTTDLCQEILTAWFSPVDLTLASKDITFLDTVESKAETYLHWTDWETK